MKEHSGKKLSQVKFCYLGDARNNMGHSLMVGAARMGMDFSIAAPRQCQPSLDLYHQCLQIAATTGAKIKVTEAVEEAVKGCDFLYTDVWVSMGEPEVVWADRIKLLMTYQVNADVLILMENSDVKFLHCLPAFHNRATQTGEKIFRQFGLESMEVTEEVFESNASIVFDQAENRMHTIKAVLVSTLV